MTFTGSPLAAAAAVHGKVPLADLEEAGILAVSGDRSKAESFVTLFVLPPKASTAAKAGTAATAGAGAKAGTGDIGTQ